MLSPQLNAEEILSKVNPRNEKEREQAMELIDAYSKGTAGIRTACAMLNLKLRNISMTQQMIGRSEETEKLFDELEHQADILHKTHLACLNLFAGTKRSAVIAVDLDAPTEPPENPYPSSPSEDSPGLSSQAARSAS